MRVATLLLLVAIFVPSVHEDTRICIHYKMNDEKLIEIVRKYEFIYNLKHPKYMDNVRKDIAWKEIGEQLKQSAIACKQRWQCLRDAYRRALNKRKRKSGQAGKTIKLWKYENEMAFVIPFFMERKTHDSIEVTSEDELSDNDENPAIESTDSEKPNTDIEIDDISANVNYANSTRLSEERSKNELEKYTKKPKAVKRKAERLEPSESTVLMAKLLENQNNLEQHRVHDELDRFFLNISDTVKKFSSYEQAVAKNKIFSIVSQMELQQFAPSSGPFAFNSSPQSSTNVTLMPMIHDNWNDQANQLLPTKFDK